MIEVHNETGKIIGVGPDAPMVVNEKGGKQSQVIAELSLLPMTALIQIGQILTEGAKKYGKDNWRQIQRYDHINHALAHLFAYCAKDTQDDHLGHAATRLLFALETKDK